MAASERKQLENQFKLMENRIRHLKGEDSKMKTKIRETKRKTSQLVSSKRRHANDQSFQEVTRDSRKHDLEQKKQQVFDARMRSQENRRQNEEKSFRDKQRKASVVKNEKLANQSIREELRKEEEIKNAEKIWKIACQEKRIENNKLYERIKKRNEIKKKFTDKLHLEQEKASEITEKIRELEDMESNLLDNLKITQQNHLNAFNEMQVVYSTKTHSLSPLRNI